MIVFCIVCICIVLSSVLEITMETFDVSSIMKKFMRDATHLMLAISFESSKRIMLVTWLECLSNVVRKK